MSIAAYPKYESYRNGVSERLDFPVPSHWSSDKARFLFKFNKGLTITKENLEDEGIPCVNYGEIHSRFGFAVDPAKHALKCVSPDYLKANAGSILRRGDFVFADTSEDIEGSGNFTHLDSDEPTFAGYHTLIARPESRTQSRYLAYMLDSAAFRRQVQKAVKGVKVFSISQGLLKNLEILLPPLPEQRAIAAFLDGKCAAIDAAVRIKEDQIALLRERRQILIQQAVTRGLNPAAPMKDGVSERLDFPVPSHWSSDKARFLFKFNKGLTITKENLEDEGIPCVNYGEIHSRFGFAVDPAKHALKCVSPDYLKANAGSILRRGDFVFADTSEDIEGSGNFTHLDSDEPTFAGYHTLIARPESRTQSRYLAYMLDSAAFRRQVQKAVKGVKVFSISQGLLKNLEILLPPLPEQRAIAAFLDGKCAAIDAAVRIKKSQIAALKEYKTSLINAAVTGKIKVIASSAPEVGTGSGTRLGASE